MSTEIDLLKVKVGVKRARLTAEKNAGPPTDNQKYLVKKLAPGDPVPDTFKEVSSNPLVFFVVVVYFPSAFNFHWN